MPRTRSMSRRAKSSDCSKSRRAQLSVRSKSARDEPSDRSKNASTESGDRTKNAKTETSGCSKGKRAEQSNHLNGQKSTEPYCPLACVLCKLECDDEFRFGKFYKNGELFVHHFCLLFACGLAQNGSTTEEGITGFLTEDIQDEVKRARSLRCAYCKKGGASIGCNLRKCQKMFHFPCGQERGALNQYFGQFRSYCIDHKPKQHNTSCNELPNVQCGICFGETEYVNNETHLKTPCCSSGWFHRLCIQKYAISAGYFFKCPFCNNQDLFRDVMLLYGVYIPDQDASWENERNAYQELLIRPECGALECLCPSGRRVNKSKTMWRIVYCEDCGSSARHVGCENLSRYTVRWKCSECVATSENLHRGRNGYSVTDVVTGVSSSSNLHSSVNNSLPNSVELAHGHNICLDDRYSNDDKKLKISAESDSEEYIDVLEVTSDSEEYINVTEISDEEWVNVTEISDNEECVVTEETPGVKLGTMLVEVPKPKRKVSVQYDDDYDVEYSVNLENTKENIHLNIASVSNINSVKETNHISDVSSCNTQEPTIINLKDELMETDRNSPCETVSEQNSKINQDCLVHVSDISDELLMDAKSHEAEQSPSVLSTSQVLNYLQLSSSPSSSVVTKRSQDRPRPRSRHQASIMNYLSHNSSQNLKGPSITYVVNPTKCKNSISCHKTKVSRKTLKRDTNQCYKLTSIFNMLRLKNQLSSVIEN